MTLKGWRSQLRWAMTQREDDPARVWLEIISIDERSKRALHESHDPAELAELQRFRARLETSIASLTEDLGDENVAPLYAWLDLVRQRRALLDRVEEARNAVTQARALRAADGSKAPKGDEETATQLARAQGQLDEWAAARPRTPPPEVLAVWEKAGGEALEASMPRDLMAVGKRGDEARRFLQGISGRAPGQHPWAGSRMEKISIPAMAVAAIVLTSLALSMSASSPSTARLVAALAVSSLAAVVALLGCGVIARRHAGEETRAAIDQVWHARMYEERTRLAELEVGWLRALVEAQKARKAFDARAAAGGQLRDFEKWRPDLMDMMQEVARDTEGGSESS